MTDIPEAWKRALGQPDAAALAGYARSRPAFAGCSPVLLVVDVTEAFVGPDLPVLEAQKHSRQACGQRAWEAMPAIAGLLKGFRRASLPVIFTVPDANQTWVGAATRGEAGGGELGSVVEAVRPRSGERVMTKSKASAFFGTSLVSGLIRNRHDTVVLVGGTTSGCIRASAVDATSYGFEVLVASDGCFDRAHTSHEVSLPDIDAKYGRVLVGEEIELLLDL